jgi:hypothetical protein
MRWWTHRRNVRRPWQPGELARGVAAALIVVGSVVGAMVSATAGAAPLGPLVTIAPSGPFYSGQLIDVNVAPNGIFQPGVSLTIEECAAPAKHSPHGQPVCDPRTEQHGRVTANRDGSLLYPGYLVYALPNAFTLHAWASHRPVCNLTHACLLVISGSANGGDGDHDSDDGGGSVWSLPFFVGPAVADPPPNTPEVPYVLALPVLAGGIFFGVILVRRRHSAPTRDS